MKKDLPDKDIFQYAPILAITQPTGSGLLNIIRVSGNNCIEIIKRFIKNKKWQNNDIRSHRIYNAFFFDPDADMIIDEIIVLVFISPYSYTREDLVEIQLNQNKFTINTIINLLLKAGIRYSDPGEFTKRAFINGRIDLMQAESLNEYLKSNNFIYSQNSLKMMRGDLKKLLITIRKKLLESLSLLEANIDFSNEDIDLIDYVKLNHEISSIIKEIQKLLENSSNYKKIRDNIKITIIGRTNVGKSSIFNLLCGKERAIVSNYPGTTRDFISEALILDNFTVNIIDTAGIRKSPSEIEKQGIDKTYDNTFQTDLIFMVFDISQKLTDDDIHLINMIKDIPVNIACLYNKDDKGPKLETDRIEDVFTPCFSCSMSAKLRKGKDLILRFLKEYLRNLVPDQNILFISNERHLSHLASICNELKQIQKLISSRQYYDDLIAFHLRESLENIHYLFGNNLMDEVLNNIFSSFCIGK